MSTTFPNTHFVMADENPFNVSKDSFIMHNNVGRLCYFSTQFSFTLISTNENKFFDLKTFPRIVKRSLCC